MQFANRTLCLTTALVTLCAGGTASAQNYVNLQLERVDDFLFPDAEFFAFVDIGVPDVPGISDVIMTLADGSQPLIEGEGDEWFAEPVYSSLADLKAAFDGSIQIEIIGTTPSVTTFTLNGAALNEGSFYNTATDVTPPTGSINVPADVTFTWTDPTGKSTPDALVVFVESENMCQEDDSLFGTMNVSDTSWNPPLALEQGFNEFGVIYVEFDDAALVSQYNVNSGAITWGDSPFAPDGYPLNTPLLILGSETIIGFEVGVPCPADFDNSGAVDVLDLIALLGAWGPNPGNVADMNGDDIVDVLDLIALLGAWGPC